MKRTAECVIKDPSSDATRSLNPDFTVCNYMTLDQFLTTQSFLCNTHTFHIKKYKLGS